MAPPIVISANSSWYLANFRAPLIAALLDQGFEVVAAAAPDPHSVRLEEAGAHFAPLRVDGRGTSPLRDGRLLKSFYSLLREVRPVAYLGYTAKPNIYGSLAAHSLDVPVINNVAGLGSAFTAPSYLGRLVGGLYKVALKRSHTVFFQNSDDHAFFVDRGWAPADRSERLPGSGVDLERFKPRPLPSDGSTECRFLLTGRLLWEKGVGEYVDAARLVRRHYPNISFGVLGFIDDRNPDSVPAKQIEAWVKDGLIDYHGTSEDVRPFIGDADCLVLPSHYREGVPRSLLEGAAMARPVITTDNVGCRDAVEPGVSGFQCEVRNAESLAQAMVDVVEMTPEQRTEMGRAGRAKMEREFDETLVIQRYLEVVESASTLARI